MSADADVFDLDGNLEPRDGTVIPTRTQFAALIQKIAEDAERGEGVSQPLAERMAQYLDAMYASLPDKPHDSESRATDPTP